MEVKHLELLFIPCKLSILLCGLAYDRHALVQLRPTDFQEPVQRPARPLPIPLKAPLTHWQAMPNTGQLLQQPG